VTKRSKSIREQRREELARQKRQRWLRIGIPAAAVVVVLVALIFTRAGGAAIEGLLDFGAQERGHDQGVVIEASSLPPVGGTHSPQWQNCGIYDEPIDAKNGIHSMEHGAVWVTYHPDLASGEVEILREAVRGQSYVLMSPFPGLASPVVLTAWGIQLEVEEASDDRVNQFISEYRLGPQTPEFGAPCDGGIGRPTG
jgi:hypothetical protein